MNTKESKNLYFLRLIQIAYESDDKLSSLKKVFDEIKIKAAEPEYKSAYINFQNFIQTIESRLMKKGDMVEFLKYSHFYDLMIDILSNNFVGDENEKQAILNIFCKDSEFEKIQRDIKDLKAIESLSIEVLKNGELFGSVQCLVDCKPLILINIMPGEYTIQLSNGRLLWTKKLKPKDILWKQVFPKQEYPAAAMTEPTKSPASISETVLNGEITLDIFPGIESGTIKLNLTKKK